MDTRLQALAGEQAGAFSAAQAAARGVGPVELRAALRRGDVVQLRRGAYATRRAVDAADDDGRYLLRAMATIHTRPGDALSHHAASALHGLPLFGHDPKRIDVLSSVQQGAHRSGLWVHPGAGVETLRQSGVRVVAPARAVVRTALTMGRDCAVVAGDAALHRHLVTEAELLAEVAAISPHEGRRRALDALLHMDGRSESVGESRTRLIMMDLGFETESQVVLVDAEGRFIARVDLLVEGVVVEFDGRVKYARSRDVEDGVADTGQVLWLEKRREDAIRRQGHPVERVIWSELRRPGLIGARIRAATALVTAPQHTEQWSTPARYSSRG
jgi:hypothetical protein